MGYSLFVTYDRLIPEVEGWAMCGKTLAQHLDQLDEWAIAQNLRPLSQLISLNAEDLEDLLDDDLDAGLEDEVEEEWFAPAEGLATVNALIQQVQENLDRVESATELLTDLTTVKHYLELAEHHQAQFHFTPDL